MKLKLLGVGLMIAAVTIGLVEYRTAGAANATLIEIRQREEGLRKQIAARRELLTTTARMAQNVEHDNGGLRQAIDQAQIADADRKRAMAEPITHDAVQARFKHARELVANGNADEALKEYLWCYDVGMPKVPAYAGVRGSYVLDEIKNLGPKGVIALEKRFAAARRAIASGDDGAIGDFHELSGAVGQNDAIIGLFDEMPAGDPRREKVAIYAFDQLLERRRYTDAMLGKSYAMMSSMFEGDAARASARSSDYAISRAANDIEALAGSGDLAHAQNLITRVLAVDSSANTRTLIEQHLTRAGHPELIPASSSK
jgi:hypothetical protein